MTRRIGIYPGTFDPVHKGHIAFALAAVKACGLDSVVLLPERWPRGKSKVTEIGHREALLRLAAAHSPALRVVILESDVFTVAKTLPELRRLFPDDNLTMLVGSDVAKSLSEWPDLDVLVAEMNVAVGLRAQDNAQEMEKLLKRIEGLRYTLVSTPHAEVAASTVRASTAIDSLYPDVARYIEWHGLYR